MLTRRLEKLGLSPTYGSGLVSRVESTEGMVLVVLSVLLVMMILVMVEHVCRRLLLMYLRV